jgi:hypothetical protein
MPNGTLDGFNHVLDFDEDLTHVFRVSAIVFFRQSFRDVAAVRNPSISCCNQPLNILVILSHSGGLLLINLFARQPWQLGDIGRDPLLFKYSFAHPFLLKGVVIVTRQPKTRERRPNGYDPPELRSCRSTVRASVGDDWRP